MPYRQYIQIIEMKMRIIIARIVARRTAKTMRRMITTQHHPESHLR
jgi:hypothetical protein